VLFRSEGEGAYYTWKLDEVESILGMEDAKVFARRFGVTRPGNTEGGRSILHIAESVEAVAASCNITFVEAESILENSKKKLLEARLKRPAPLKDDKVIASWNGLAISAFSRAYAATGVVRYLELAKAAATFVLTHHVKDGRLYRRYRNGDTAVLGTLEDYSHMIQGLLDLFEAGQDPQWLESAKDFLQKMNENFWDAEHGGYYFDQSKDRIPIRLKDCYDGPTPSGNSIAALDLLRMSEFTTDGKLAKMGERTLQIFADKMESEPSAHTYLLSALDFYFGPRKEIVIVSKLASKEAIAMVTEVQRRFLPNKVLVLSTEKSRPKLETVTDLVLEKTELGGKPTCYVCENFACKRPVNDLDSLKTILSSKL
jgi:uncharacterized protein YyaL (SSP411 family)